MRHLYILGTILLTVYAQLVLKWQMSTVDPMPAGTWPVFRYLLATALRPWILSCFAAALLAFFCWASALRTFELSYAYPFMGASFVLVLWLSVAIFREPLTAAKLVGTALIVAGIVIGSRS
jgi:multidrug transporter EmrE-like cation transporter